MQKVHRAAIKPIPLPPAVLDPPALAGTVVATAHATTGQLGGLPDPSGGAWGVTDGTYRLTIDAPEALEGQWRYRRFSDVVLEAQRRARAAGAVAEAVLQARDGTWYLAAVRFTRSIPGHPGFDLLDAKVVSTIDLTRAAAAAALLAIVGVASGVNFSSNPWPSAQVSLVGDR